MTTTTEKHVALVTGGNRGLGLETARQLGKRGYRVVVTARDLAKAQSAVSELKRDGVEAEAVALDVTAPTTIDAAAKEVERRFGRLDVLVNNAGVAGGGFETPVSKVTAEDVFSTFKTNTLGPLAVTQAFLPLLRKSPSARIVNVSSGMGQISDMGGGSAGYRLSKVSLNALTKIVNAELPDGNIKINTMCPGWVRTDMGGSNASRSPEQGADTAVWLATLSEHGPSGGFYRDRQPISW